jgi:hypothetical protein
LDHFVSEVIEIEERICQAKSGALPASPAYNSFMSTDLFSSPAAGTLDTAILTRTIAPQRSHFSPEVAAEILHWDFTPEDQREMEALSAKARAGTLTPEEEVKIDSYIRVSHIVNLLQAKARLALKPSASN